MDTESEPDAFGYRRVTEGLVDVASVQVYEGKNAETLQPTVILAIRTRFDESLPSITITLRSDPDRPVENGLAMTQQLGLTLNLDSAEFLADELRRIAGIARGKHWEPT